MYRVNDSDDLVMTESEVGKIALNIEKEMFNLFQVTDNRYKSKYRSIMFNLKDPKNQVCVLKHWVYAKIYETSLTLTVLISISKTLLALNFEAVELTRSYSKIIHILTEKK